ncbi:MAG TPA: OsmC family protein [Tepidiformaceae bacterium]|nr:OsmC family protein [Tepidiformaceae bacterium]
MAGTRQTSHARLALRGDHSQAFLGETATPVVYGAAGSSTLDHIIAAVGACMFETLALALAVRGVEFERAKFAAAVEGTIEGRTPASERIAGIHIHYTLAIPARQRPAADRALRFHARGCPAHETLRDAVAITWSADITEG